VLARKSLLLFIVNMARSFLGFLSTVVIARWMGAEALGTVGYLLGLLGLLAVCLDMGFAFAHLKRVSDSKEDPAALIGTFLLLKTALVLVFLIAAILLPFVKGYLGQPLFQSLDERYAYYVIAAFYILHSLSSVFLFTFEARLETAKQSAVAFVGSLLSFAAKALVAIFGLGVIALSGAYLIEPLAFLIFALLLFSGYRVVRPRREHFASYIRYTLPLTLNTIAIMVIANVNPVLIRAFWTTAEVGYYTSVLGFAVLLDRVASTVTILFFPQASSDAARGDWEEIRRRLFVIERYVLTVLVPLGVVLIFFSNEVVVTAFGTEFAPAAPILMCMVANSILSAIFQPYSTVLYAIEKQRYLLISSMLGLLTLLLLDAALVPNQMLGVSLAGLSGTGAAMALVAMTIAGGIIQVKAVSRYAKIGFYWKALLYLLAGGIMYLLMRAGSGLVAMPVWLAIPLLTALGLGAYLTSLILLGQFTRADAQVLLNMLHPSKMIAYISTELDRHE